MIQEKNSRRWPIYAKILCGVIVGIAVGLTCNALSVGGLIPRDRLTFVAVHIADPIGRIFLRVILMVVIPLVVSALALAVLELGDVRRLGRLGLRTLGLTFVLSGTAVAISLLAVNILRPGDSLSGESQKVLASRYALQARAAVEQGAAAKSLDRILLDIIPENPLQEMVGALDGSSPGNGMLAVMFFALMLGIALTVAGPRTDVIVRLLEGAFDLSMVVIAFAMRLAPWCVACLLFAITAQLGGEILLSLAWFVITALTGMLVQMLVVYPLFVWRMGRRSPARFYRDILEAIVTAFGTSSSNATLPTTLRVAKEQLNLPRSVSQFVLTIGATGNQNGTALYEGVVVLFLAQLMGHDLTMADQIRVVLMAVLAVVGTAGVPGGSIPMIAMVLQSVGIEGSSIGIILGIDRLLDMCRTVLNVTGDLVLAVCVARGGEPGEPDLCLH
jgi:DAACS family dicarboxylate/amino acid:cation (Na+ or H+) symporter